MPRSGDPVPLVRCLAVAAALTVATVPAAHARGTVTLDGKARKHAKVTGSLIEPATRDLSGRSTRQDPATPTLTDCGETSCDVTTVKLMLPRNVASGWFTAEALIDRTINVRLALYDSRGRVRLAADVPSDWQQHPDHSAPDGAPAQYRLSLYDPRLPAGTYRLVVFDNGGRGAYSLDVSYEARRPAHSAHK